MRFAPKTETQIQEERDAALGVWPKGTYDFEVSAAEDRVSKAGNEMIELTLHVFNPEGDRKIVRDWLLESVPHKLRHAAEALGVLPDYDRGAIVADRLVGKTGKCRLGIEKDKTGQFPDKNRIEDYERPRAGIGAPRSSAPGMPLSREKQYAGGGTDLSDEIPF